MAIDYEKELRRVADMAIFTDSIRPETIRIGAQNLDTIDIDYGPNSDNPLTYHNARHSLNRCEGLVVLANLLAPYIAGDQLRYIYDLGIIGMSGHDRKQGLDPHSNEMVSSRLTVELVERHGGRLLNTGDNKTRLHNGIMGTEAHVDNTGKVIQPNVARGPSDPLIFMMAFSDIGGIAIEGPDRMLNDSVRLFFEYFRNPNPIQLLGWMASQTQFIRQQFNDHVMVPKIAHHWRNPAAVKAVYSAMHFAFYDNIQASYTLAKGFQAHGTVIEE